MSEDNFIEVRDTFTAWFDITLKMLRKKIYTVGIQDWTKIRPSLSGQESLFNSLRYQMELGSELIQKGILQYNLPGKFTDMGVGRNYSKGNLGNVDAIKKERRKKEWYSKLFYAQVMTLGEIVRNKFGEGAASQIVASLEAIKTMKYDQYRLSELARNARNYRKQVNLPLEERTWLKTKGNYTH